jgi:hypothetical protein
MSFNLLTTDDLKANALWLGGEPTDGASDYDAQVLTWMQLVYNTLVNGGTLGTRDVAQAAGLYEHLVDIPTTDWMWLRKFPPFAFNTTPAILGASSSAAISGPPPEVIGTVSLTTGSPGITFSIAPSVSVKGWRLKLLTQAPGVAFPPITVPRIADHAANATTATLDAGWPQDTQVASNYVLFQIEYPLPADFLRFVESPAVHGGWISFTPPRLNMGSVEQVGDQFPIQTMSQGPPTAAARMNDTTIQVNRWDTQGYRSEFSYIFQPPALALAQLPLQEPLVPARFRQVIAIGAAMLIAHDKVDSRTASLSSQFREIIAHMGNEWRHEQGVGSELAGVHLYRRNGGRRGMLKTASGLPLF